jgi:outer membrane protein TolC
MPKGDKIMTSEEIRNEIATLEAQIEADREELAQLLGVEVATLDLATVTTDGMDEAATAEVDRLVEEINSLTMRIQALNEMLGSATSNENFTGGEF